MNQRNSDVSRKRAKRTSQRDIGSIPACGDIISRVKCDQSLLYFLKTCFPQKFNKPFGAAHLQYIEALQNIIQKGGVQSIGFARGAGKSTIAQLAVLWGAVTGRRTYSLFIALSAKKSKQANESIYKALQTNDRLLELYPQACYPIRCLQGSNSRARSQLHKGQKTYLQFGKKVVLAAVGYQCDNCVMNINSVTSGIRGQAATRKDGSQIRPSLVIIDDIVNDKTANSLDVQEKLQNVIQNSIMFLAGPGISISVCFIGTIVGKNDVCAKYLDRKKKPLWKGLIMPALYSMPKNMDLWQKYKELYFEDIELADITRKLSTKYYLDNKQKMDEGASASWQHRVQEYDKSAIHHAMTVWAKNQDSFFSQYQLSPKQQQKHALKLKEQQVKTCIDSFKRGERPSAPHKICIGIDINKPAITWVVAAYTLQGVFIIDYGTTPQSPTRYFSLKDFKMPLERVFPAVDIDHSIKMGLDKCMADLTEKYKPDVVLVDRGYDCSIQLVAQVCLKWQKATGNLYLSAKGHANGAKSTANFADSKKKPGQTVDPGGLWKLHTKAIYGSFILHETDMNKTQVYNLWKNNRIRLYQANQQYHKLFIQHMCSQYPISVQVFDNWKQVWEKDKSHNQQDHFWDALLLTNIGNSLIGNKVFKSYKIKQQSKKIQAVSGPRQPRVNMKW